MKVVIFSYKDKKDILDLIGNKVEIVEKNPDVVIVKGGDGALMEAENEFPGVSKLLVKASKVCKLCPSFENKEIIRKFLEGDYYEEEFFKIEAKTKDKKLIALNDIIVHNKDPRHAIRYHVFVNNKQSLSLRRFVKQINISYSFCFSRLPCDKRFVNEIIGDGVVVATPLGSTGYYRSITDSFFQTGIGLAFNNSTEQSDHAVLKENSIIKVEILRGPAVVYGDNNPKEIELFEGGEILIKKSEETAKIIKLKE